MGDGLAFVATTNLLSNTGVLSLQGDTGALSLSAGSGIGISGLTISNTGVLSLQGDTGALSFTAGTGIGISGLTFTNTGIISASAGSGISVSGTNPLTIENTGVLSLQGDTGALSLGAGSGIGISGLTISNTGVLGVGGSTTSYLTGNIEFKSGSGISIAQSTTAITVGNTGVLSLQGDTGALSLGAGTGIGISGLTISNTGVTSLGAGSGISVSGSTGGITVGNTGVLSLQGDTGALTLTANSGISISGLGIGIDFGGAYTWTAEQTFSDILTVGGSAGLDSANIGLYPYATSGIVLGEAMSFISIWGTVDHVGGWIGENYNSIQMGIYNRTTTTQGALAGSKWMMNLGVNLNGAVYTFVPTNYDIGVSASENASVRNTLDDGSGNMSIAGTLTAQYINANVNNDNPNGATPTVVLSIYGGNAGGAHAGQYGLGISNSTLDFLAPSGENFAWWASTSQIASMNSSGDFSVNGNIISNANGGYVSAYNEQVLMFTGGSAVNGNGGDAGISIQGRPRIGDWGQWLTIGEPNGTYNGNIIQITSSGIFTGHSSGITTSPSIRNTLDDGSGNMSIAGYLIAHPTMGSNVVSGTLWNLSPTSSNVTFGSSNTGTVTLYIETIRATTTGKYYVQTYNSTANNYPTFWATYLEANVTYYVGQTFVIGIPGGDTIENWYAGGNAGGTLTVTGILNLG